MAPAVQKIRATGVAASILSIIVAVAAFWLSFSALSELARMTGVFPADLSWLFAVVIDGFMIQATLCLVDATATGDASGKRYHWIMLTVFSAISVAGNFYHALLVSHSNVMAPWVAAIIAVVPPIALLSSSHGLVVYLWRRPDRAVHTTPESESLWQGDNELQPVAEQELAAVAADSVQPELFIEPPMVQPARVTEPAVRPSASVAAADIDDVRSEPEPVQTVDGVRQAQMMKAIALVREQQHTHQEAADKIGVSRSTVTRWVSAFTEDVTGEVDLVTTP